MSSTSQRKRRNATPSSSRSNAKTSRTGSRTGSVPAASAPDLNDNMDFAESSRASSEEDVVDLTCEGSEPAAVVDLTNNDSVVVSLPASGNSQVVDEAPVLSLSAGPRSRRALDSESYVLSSDEEEEETNTALNAAMLSSLQASSRARSTPGTVSCPVCMDAYGEIIDSGRLVVSTKCGHLFCSQCLRDSLTRSHTCPTCRKKLTHKQYHPIYI